MIPIDRARKEVVLAPTEAVIRLEASMYEDRLNEIMFGFLDAFTKSGKYDFEHRTIYKVNDEAVYKLVDNICYIAKQYLVNPSTRITEIYDFTITVRYLDEGYCFLERRFECTSGGNAGFHSYVHGK